MSPPISALFQPFISSPASVQLLFLGEVDDSYFLQSPQQICIDSVRAALLDTTPSNVAYKLKPRITEWKVEGEVMICHDFFSVRIFRKVIFFLSLILIAVQVLQIVVEINCDKERIGRLLVGKVSAMKRFINCFFSLMNME